MDNTAVNQSTELSRNLLFPVEEKEYELLEEIGKGATATVYKGRIVKRDHVVAVKKINLERFSVNIDELLKEIQVMSQCNHENVVKFYTSFVVRHDLWLIMEMLDGGSLLDVIRYTMTKRKCTNGVFNEVAIATVLREVLKGLDYFHSNGHIHRDIKAGNILLSLDGAVKIADFGVSAFIASCRGDNTKEASRHTFVGTPCWMAPEVMSHTPEGYNTRVDIWSFGILALELATGKAPYHMYPPVKVLVMTLQSDPPTLETCEEVKEQYKHYSRNFRKFIDCCLQKNPNDRLSAKHLLKNDFLKKGKDKAYVARNLALEQSLRSTIDMNDLPRSQCSRTVRQSFDGEWYFDDDEVAIATAEGDEETEPQEDSTPQAAQNMAAVDDLPSRNEALVQLDSSAHAVETTEDAGMNNEVGVSADDEGDGTRSHVPNDPADSCDQPKADVRLKLTLRMRNKSNQLNDIKFDFDMGKDTCDIVAEELVNAGLIEGEDRIVVAFNMAKIIEDSSLKSVIFVMPSLRSADVEVDPNKLVGCAMWINKHTGDDVEL